MENKEMKLLKKIENDYEVKESTSFDELKELNKRVYKPALLNAYILGSIYSLILGFGMCLAMEVILPGNMIFGIIIGLVGIALCILNYYVYKKFLSFRKVKYHDRILRLVNEVKSN